MTVTINNIYSFEINQIQRVLDDRPRRNLVIFANYSEEFFQEIESFFMIYLANYNTPFESIIFYDENNNIINEYNNCLVFKKLQYEINKQNDDGKIFIVFEFNVQPVKKEEPIISSETSLENFNNIGESANGN